MEKPVYVAKPPPAKDQKRPFCKLSAGTKNRPPCASTDVQGELVKKQVKMNTPSQVARVKLYVIEAMLQRSVLLTSCKIPTSIKVW